MLFQELNATAEEKEGFLPNTLPAANGGTGSGVVGGVVGEIV